MPDPTKEMPMRSSRGAAPLTAAAVFLVGILAACTATDPRLEDEPTPPPPAAAPASTKPAASAPAGAVRVTLAVTTPHVITVDVTDASSTLVGATSGPPGDGASVEAYTIAVANPSPTWLRLTWVGGPCDSANLLSIDASVRRLVLVQPECPGDAIATDRVLDLQFSTPIKASDIETFIQDGLDT
jgi:hypothetical protein